MSVEIIKSYFPHLSATQIDQYATIGGLYADWNQKINLISRKDIENLYERHILHSLGIAKTIRFTDGTTVIDVGTGGGLPGIPLAIMFPQVKFLLVDSVGKKVRAAEEIARQTGLDNVECRHERIEDERLQADFVVSRAVMPMAELMKASRKNIARTQQNALPNGFLCLKGGDLTSELQPFRNKAVIYNLSDYFKEDFFETKKVVYVQY